MKQASFLISFLLIIIQTSISQVQSEWRGIGRTGVYHEDGLLEKWPDKGPEQLWINDSIPNGHSSVSIAYQTIYLTGLVDTMDVLLALDMNGKLKWQTAYGRAWDGSFPETRSTPTIENNKIYVTSGRGDIACLDANSGVVLWSQKTCEIYEAIYNNWGVAESPIIVDEKIIISPIGKKTTVVALNKRTGETIWESESINDSLAYVSPILVEFAGKKIIVNVSGSYIFGIDAANGDILWKYRYYDVKPKNSEIGNPIINCITPIYHDGQIYITSGYNHVGAMLKMDEDAGGVELLWSDTILDTHHGGVVKVGDYIYGSNWINNGKGNWCSLKWETGEKMYEKKWGTKGAIIANKDKLYCYDEKRGNIALVEAGPEDFKIISSFRFPKGKGRGPYWSHPVIKDGILYVRHGTALVAYNISVK